MNSKVFNSHQQNMVICPFCYGCGYIYNPDHQVCTSCEGLGLIEWEGKKDTDICPDDDRLASITQI